MKNFLRNALGIIYATETSTHITLGGVRTASLLQDIYKAWETSKISLNMFSKLSNSEISFAKFFAPDVHYMLQQLSLKRRTRFGAGALETALKVLEEETWLKRLSEPVTSRLDKSKVNLFHLSPLPHQSEFFELYDDRVQRYGMTGYLLSAAAGSGKTLTGLMLAEMLHADQVIMIVPKNAVWKVWSRHLNEEYKQPQAHWIAADDKPYNGEKFLIGHYESLDKVIAAVRTNHKSNAFVILDESHNMNEAGSLRTQKFIELCKTVGAKNVLWSSGTPLKALGYEAIPLLTTIDPLFTPEVQERFKKIYGREAKRALDILRNRMGIISYRVEKTSVVDNKPTTHEISVEIPNARKYELETIGNEMREFIKKRLEHYEDRKKYFEKVYDDALRIHEKTLDTREQKASYATYKTYIATIRKGYDSYTMGPLSQYCNRYELTVIMPTLSRDLRAEFKNARSVVKYVELKVLGEALGGVLGKARVDCHLDMLPGIPFADVINGAQKKTVIFTSYVEVADAIDKRLRSEGFSPLVVHGGTNKNLSSIVTEFEKNPKANPLIATYQSLSTAVPLIVANTTIFINQPFRDGDLTQARARTDRLGQDAPVHFWNCLLNTGDKPNISTRSRDIMQWSRDQIAAIMGDSYSHDVAQVLTTAGGAYAEEAITEKDVLALEYYHETI